MMDKRGAWGMPKYLRKKKQLLMTDDDNQVFTIREIMPQCILDQVRATYPNPIGRPYMDHEWY